MIRKYFLVTILSIQTIGLMAQVGINNTTPTSTLEIGGDVLVQQKLYLESPGSYDNSANSNLMVLKNSNAEVVKYDITGSDYGPLNQIRYIFTRVSADGLLGGYNTKIDPTLYTIAVHGFSYVAVDSDGQNPNTNVPVKSSAGDKVVEGQQFYAAVVTTTKGKDRGTHWWLFGYVNNGKFQQGGDTRVNISMDVMIYRNEFITKIFPGVQTVDMGGSTTGTAPLPDNWQ